MKSAIPYLVWNEDRDDGSGTHEKRETAARLAERLDGPDSDLLLAATPPPAISYRKLLTGWRARKEHGEGRVYLCRTRTP